MRWILKDAQGAELRSSDTFGSRDGAETWLGQEWQRLLDEGAESVALVEDGHTVYEMGLREA